MCLWHLRWETVWSIQVHIVVEQFGWKRPPESNPSSLLVSCLRCQAASIFKDSSVPYAQHPWGKKKKKLSLCCGNAPSCSFILLVLSLCTSQESWFLHDGVLPYACWRQPKELPLVFSSTRTSKWYVFNSNPSVVLQQPVVSVASPHSKGSVLPYGGFMTLCVI